MAYRVSPRLKEGMGGNDNADWRARGLKPCEWVTRRVGPVRRCHGVSDLSTPYNITERTVSGEYTIYDPMARDLLIKEALRSITGFKA